MKHCYKCGCEIINGMNGCTLMAECFICHQGPPHYPKPIAVAYLGTLEDLDSLEDRCLDMGEQVDP